MLRSALYQKGGRFTSHYEAEKIKTPARPQPNGAELAIQREQLT